jgi:Putative esterase
MMMPSGLADAKSGKLDAPQRSLQCRHGRSPNEETTRDFMFKPHMALLITALACSSLSAAPPVRKFDDPGAPPFKLLKEGENPPLDASDNFVVGPKYVPAPERKKVDGVPEGKVEQFVIDSKETKLFNIWIANGGGDAQGHERGKEYDNMNGGYAEYIETEVLPRVEKNTNVKLTKDPDGRAAMGNSSGGSAALIMAWFRTDLYHRVLTTSGTFVNQAWPFDPEYPDGAWGFHETLIPNSLKKPIRLFISVGDADLLNPNIMRDDMHDWVKANHRMAKVLKAKGYEYQYLFCRGSGHGVGNAQAQFLPHGLEWVWKGYAPKNDK